MTCEEIQRLLSAYIDGELDDETRRLVEAHLEECEPCRLDHLTLAKTVKMIHSLAQVPWDAARKLSRP